MKFLSIYFLCMLKFIAGPTLGYAAGFSFSTTVMVTVLGMMTSVLIFTYLGDIITAKILKKIFPTKKVFSKRNRKVVDIRNKYGLIGVAALTPLIFTPIGGTIILSALGTPRDKIIIYMFGSALFWAVMFSVVIYVFGGFLPEGLIPQHAGPVIFQYPESTPFWQWTAQF